MMLHSHMGTGKLLNEKFPSYVQSSLVENTVDMAECDLNSDLFEVCLPYLNVLQNRW